MHLRPLPTKSILAVLACAGAIVALACGPQPDARADPSPTVAVDAARATAVSRAADAAVATVAETAAPAPEPAAEPTPDPTEPPPPPPPPPAPRPPAPPPPPNPGGLGISGRVTSSGGAGYGGVCVTIGPPIRCATTTAASGTYFVSLDSAPLGLAWDVRYLVGGVVRVERLGVVVSGPVVLNVTIP